MGTLVTSTGIPHFDMPKFSKLPDAEKWEVLELLEVMRAAAGARRPRAYLAEVAARNMHRRGWSLKQLERKWYKYRKKNDWRELINHAKAPEREVASVWVTEAVIEWWRACCDRHKRSFMSAWLELVGKYRAGEMIGDVDWKKFWPSSEMAWREMGKAPPADMPLPPGWSYHNLMRHKPRAIETAVARHGRHAARKFSERVRTTRVDLPVGARYEFDDMWHNHITITKGYRKTIRPLELSVIDASSDYKPVYGIKQRREDVDGKRKNLTQADMLLTVAHVGCHVGYHKDGCVFVVEGGAASIPPWLEIVLMELSGNRIRVSRSGVDRIVPYGKWGYDRKGNPDHKAHIEGAHNLIQNRLDMLPSYMGSNSRVDKPEDFDALCNTVDKMLAAREMLPEELSDRLKFPVLDFETFHDVVDVVYGQIFDTRDHELEGWEKRMIRQWRALPGEAWKGEAEFAGLPEEQQKLLAPLIQQEGNSRVVRMSRREAWEAGQADLVRLPDYAAAMICAPLAEERKCPPAEIVFIANGVRSFYRVAACTGPDGARVELKEGRKYRWLVNPFDPRVVFVSETDGKYVGKCERAEQVDRGDDAAVKARIAETRKAFEEALAPQKRRSRPAALRQADDMAHNTGLLRAGAAEEARRLTEGAAISEERRRAIEDVSLDDLSGAKHEAADADDISLDELAGAGAPDVDETGTTASWDDLL